MQYDLIKYFLIIILAPYTIWSSTRFSNYNGAINNTLIHEFN